MLNVLNVDPASFVMLEQLFTNEAGLIQPVEASRLERFTPQQIAVFCYFKAIYQVPTVELIEFLREEVKGKKALEIGAGNGCIGRYIPVPMCDSFLQEHPHIKEIYTKMRQPTITYGKDVSCINANEAVKTYQPEIIIGCWVTQFGHNSSVKDSSPFGIKETALEAKRYLMVGNEDVHKEKIVLKKYPFKKLKFPWLYSRSIRKELNVIYDIDLSNFGN